MSKNYEIPGGADVTKEVCVNPHTWEEELEVIEQQQQQLFDVEDISEEKETEATVRRKLGRVR